MDAVDYSTGWELVSVRQAVLRDAHAVRVLRLEGLLLNPEAFGSDYEREVIQPVTKWEERLSPQPNNVVFVAESSTELVGMCGVFRSELVKIKHSASIYGVYVRPDWRGRGLGVRLIVASLGWARQNGLKIVKLAVVSSNAAAIRGYQKAGFREYGLEPAALFYAGMY